ncbi:hypothetical protein [Streptomyces sp. 11x1]|uniref:hypothetical protein n=1 Tax=Streptomyces sp. 11x1 TaxID=3038642 RepID=UPI00293112C2|nr:hypothetical protein [Streptomyces sp. 11x1]WNZ11486.1 hypothetical protein P8T65_30670 [Streptomyces sp. 11x1]
MSGDPFAEEFGAGGPSDDGVGMEAWRMSLRLDEARAAFTVADRDRRTSPVLAALLAPLSGSEGEGVR